MCHVSFPKLNSFGEAFAGNVYQMSGEDLKAQTVDTRDDKLFLLSKLPLAIRKEFQLLASKTNDVSKIHPMANIPGQRFIKKLKIARLTGELIMGI